MRVGIIGTGYAARQHIEAIRSSGDIDLAVICEPLSQSRTPAYEWAEPARSLTLDQLLCAEDIQIVGICTPPGAHAALAIAALRSGKGVVIEKPAAASLAELESILQERTSVGLPVAVMHQHRFVLPAEIVEHHWSSHCTAIVEVYKPRGESYFLSSPWRTQPGLSGGGAFAHLGIHYADLACQLLGTPEAVTGVVSCDYLPGIDTRVAIAARFESGSILSLTCDCIGAIRKERLSVRDGGMEFDILDGVSRRMNGGLEIRGKSIPKSNLRASVYREVCEALASGSVVLPRADAQWSRSALSLMGHVQRLSCDSTSPFEQRHQNETSSNRR